MAVPIKLTMKVLSVERFEWSELMKMSAVQKKRSNPDDTNYDENNNIALSASSASVEVYLINPALFGKFKPGQLFYIDIIPAEEG